VLRVISSIAEKHIQKYEGKWYPGTRIPDNTQLFHLMMEAAGVPQPSPLTINK